MPHPPADEPSDRGATDGSRSSGIDASASRPTRRRVLAGISGVAAIGSIAGCGGRSRPEGTATDTPPSDPTGDFPPAPEPVGPWPQARADAGNTGFVAATGPTDDPSLRWRVTAAGTVGASVGRAPGSATTDPGVYVAAEDGRVAAVDSDGEERWQTALPEARFPPAVGSGRVVVSTGGALAVLDADSGDRRGSIDLPADSFDTPTLVDDRALVGTFSGGVVAVDLESRTRLWQSGEPSRTSPPAVEAGTAYVTARRWEADDGAKPGVIAALDVESGAVEWEVGVDGEPTAPPAVRSGVVYAGTNRGRVHAVDADTGDRRWREAVGDWVTRGPTAADDGVYVVVLGEGPVKLGRDGAVEWRSADDVGGGTNPILTDDLAVVGTDDGVAAVGRADGRTRWQADTDAGVRHDVRIVDGRVYAGDGYGDVVALDVESGEQVWRHPMRPARMPGPVVGPRTVAGGSRDGGTYDLLATEGVEFRLSGGAATRGITPAILDDRDRPPDGSPGTGTADGDLVFGNATRTASESTAGGPGRETLLGGGVDGSLFRVRTTAYGDRPAGDLGPTPTPIPGPDDPTATPHIDFPEPEPVWTAMLDTEVRSPVTYANGVAYVGTAGGMVGVDPRDGTERFRVSLGAAVDGAPAVGDGRVFAVTASGRLVGIAVGDGVDASDRIDWEATLDAGSGAGPTVADGTVFVAGDDGRIAAYLADGDSVWDRSLNGGITGGTAVTDTHVVAGTEAAEVVALDRDDGSVAWRAGTRGPVRGTPAVAGGTDATVYAADHDGTLSVFDAADGAVRFRHRVGRWLDAPPAVGHGTVFVADQTGRVYAIVGE